MQNLASHVDNMSGWRGEQPAILDFNY